MSDNSIGIYIHWPFCKKICHYCNFNRYLYKDVDQKEWLDAYISAIRYYRTIIGFKKVESIFFGGGTPSLMEVDLIGKIINEISLLFTLNSDAEITVEINPTSFETQKIKSMRSVGVNRVSMGIQSLVEKNLLFLGRNHSAADAMRAMEHVEQYFDNFSFDFIYALPDQTLEEWEKELSLILSFSMPHLSLYQLSIENNTKFMQLYKCGMLKPVCDDSAALFYERTNAMLKLGGFQQYEISNYSKSGKECKHNMRYWLYKDYIGIGPNAHGRLRTERNTFYDFGILSPNKDISSPSKDNFQESLATVDIKMPKTWLQQVSAKGHGLESITSLSKAEVAMEKLLMGLRTSMGIDMKDSGIDSFVSSSKIQELEEMGLLYLKNARMMATDKGKMVLNSVINHILL